MTDSVIAGRPPDPTLIVNGAVPAMLKKIPSGPDMPFATAIASRRVHVSDAGRITRPHVPSPGSSVLSTSGSTPAEPLASLFTVQPVHSAVAVVELPLQLIVVAVRARMV